MLLTEIIQAIRPEAIHGEQMVSISNISNNSKLIKPNGLFICIAGYRQDGHLFVDDAINRGAVAIITEKKLDVPVTQLVVRNSRLSQTLSSHKFFNSPTNKFKLVGITGTNGKTTSSYLTAKILLAAEYPTGLISTVEYKVGNTVLPATHTTPDALELGHLFQQMIVQKIKAAVMEVSSHALELHRVTGCNFYATVFTNITRDHFEFHHNFQNYLQAKAKLFAHQCNWSSRPPEECHAIINADDPYSSYIREVAQAKNIITYGFNDNAHVRVTSYDLHCKSSVFQVKIKNKRLPIYLPIPGLFNIYNGLAAIAASLSFNIDKDIIQQAVASFNGVPGRCEFIECGQDFRVIVDFAHNPSSLYNILATIPYPSPKTKKIIVFGCEGGKDPGKRSLMGSIAARYADFCVITTDNIYAEDPLEVAQDVEQGLLWGGKKPNQYKIILDRFQAIQYALKLARPGDTVIIAGKGHETKQIIHKQVIPFDDRLVVRKILGGKH